MRLLGSLRHTKHVEVITVARKPKKSKSKAGGLGKWFGEEWTDVKTGKPCGRKKGESRSYPACRPKAVASKISKKEAAKKTGPKKVKWSTTASGRKRT